MFKTVHEELVALINSHFPKIKQLEWEEYNNELEANAPFGIYRIETIGNQFKVYLIGGLISRRNSLEEAKQAAQDHFEKKVRECLVWKHNYD